jgi:hypothetical protein
LTTGVAQPTDDRLSTRELPGIVTKPAGLAFSKRSSTDDGRQPVEREGQSMEPWPPARQTPSMRRQRDDGTMIDAEVEQQVLRMLAPAPSDLGQ